VKGAKEYCDLFKKNTQIGRLYLVPGSHARGRTFRIYILPDGEAATPNGNGNGPLNNGAAGVYGVVSGQIGWTESYGWLHKGKWQEDFYAAVKNKEKEISEENAEYRESCNKMVKDKKDRVSKFLQDY